MKKPLVIFDHVQLRRDGISALRDVTVTLYEGEFIALIGPNGGGKSSMVQLMVGLLEPTKGRVTIFGEIAKSVSQRERIGYVSQKIATQSLDFPLCVEDIVRLGRIVEGPLWRRWRDQENLDVENVCRLCQIDHLKHRMIGELSGGERQRVFLARALVRQPKILILDEPNTGLDAQATQTFYHLLKHLHEQGVTIVLVSHDIGVVSSYVSRVISVQETIQYDGDPHCLVSHDHLQKLYGASMCCVNTH